jgi:hypothetical protein
VQHGSRALLYTVHLTCNAPPFTNVRQPHTTHFSREIPTWTVSACCVLGYTHRRLDCHTACSGVSSRTYQRLAYIFCNCLESGLAPSGFDSRSFPRASPMPCSPLDCVDCHPGPSREPARSNAIVTPLPLWRPLHPPLHVLSVLRHPSGEQLRHLFC